jgi:hypothetical protein
MKPEQNIKPEQNTRPDQNARPDQNGRLDQSRNLASSAARPQFGEMSEEPAYTARPRDYASDFDGGLHAPAALEEHRAQPVTALFTEPDEESLRELDTPTFMRRLQF